MTGGTIAHDTPAPGRGPVPAPAGGGDLRARRQGRTEAGTGPSDAGRRHRRGLRRPRVAAPARRSELRGRATRADRRQPPRARLPAPPGGRRRAAPRGHPVRPGRRQHVVHVHEFDERNAPDAVQDPGEKPHQILPTEGLGHQTVAAAARRPLGDGVLQRQLALPPAPVRPGERLRRQSGHRLGGGRAGLGGRAVAADRLHGHRTTCRRRSRSRRCRRRACGRRRPKVRVETEKGSRTSFLRPNGQTQSIKAPAGSTSWMKLTIVDSVSRRSGLTGAGFSEITSAACPGDPAPAAADRRGRNGRLGRRRRRSISLHRTPDPTGLSADRHRGGPAPPLLHGRRRGRTR